MGDVKRYAFQIHRRPYGLEEVGSGNLVMHSDYAKLEAEAQALREEAAALRARVVVPVNLLERCREILEWQKTGILKGDALRSYCQSKIWGRDPSALRMGEGETAQEAYRFIDELAHLNGKAVSEGLLRDALCNVEAQERVIGREMKLGNELRAMLGEGNGHE